MVERSLNRGSETAGVPGAPAVSGAPCGPSETDPLAVTSHRPWPLPRGPWVMGMTWCDLLFAHWPIEPEALRACVPAPLEVDTFAGSAWLAVTPFVMTRVRPRGWPAALGLHFCELNVRTYVTHDGKPGVYFFSLDAVSRLAVRAARWSWGLPYHDARMSHRREGDGWHAYVSERTHARAPAARLAVRYRPIGEAQVASAGSFEHFATERYALYTVDRRGRAFCGEIHHAPWRLQPAEAVFETLEMTQALGVVLPEVEPRLHFAHRLAVVAWAPRRA